MKNSQIATLVMLLEHLLSQVALPAADQIKVQANQLMQTACADFCFAISLLRPSLLNSSSQEGRLVLWLGRPVPVVDLLLMHKGAYPAEQSSQPAPAKHMLRARAASVRSWQGAACFRCRSLSSSCVCGPCSPAQWLSPFRAKLHSLLQTSTARGISPGLLSHRKRCIPTAQHLPSPSTSCGAEGQRGSHAVAKRHEPRRRTPCRCTALSQKEALLLAPTPKPGNCPCVLCICVLKPLQRSENRAQQG